MRCIPQLYEKAEQPIIAQYGKTDAPSDLIHGMEKNFMAEAKGRLQTERAIQKRAKLIQPKCLR